MNSLLAKQAIAKFMKSGYPHVGISVRHDDIHALFHFFCGLLGERKGEYFRGKRLAGTDQVFNAFRNDGGFAGPCTRDNEERAFTKRYRVMLLCVEFFTGLRDTCHGVDIIDLLKYLFEEHRKLFILRTLFQIKMPLIPDDNKFASQ